MCLLCQSPILFLIFPHNVGFLAGGVHSSHSSSSSYLGFDFAVGLSGAAAGTGAAETAETAVGSGFCSGTGSGGLGKRRFCRDIISSWYLAALLSAAIARNRSSAAIASAFCSWSRSSFIISSAPLPVGCWTGARAGSPFNVPKTRISSDGSIPLFPALS